MELKDFARKRDQLQREKERMSEKYGITMTPLQGQEGHYSVRMTGIEDRLKQTRDLTQFDYTKILNKQ